MLAIPTSTPHKSAPTTSAPVPKPELHTLNVERIRADFPVLRQQVRGRQLVYLDNAATSQTPQSVIDALVCFYTQDHANIHRGVHTLSQRCTSCYERSRVRIKEFISARSTAEIIFTRGTTEAINLVAHSYGTQQLRAGDEVLVSEMEHHSNIVPWQLLCERTGAILRVIPMDDTGTLLLDRYAQLLSPKTKIVAVTHVSNALGTINPVEEIIRLAHDVGARVIIDGAQAVAHVAVDVQQLDADFYVFSSHKMCGPTGVGVLYGKKELLNAMPPYQSGGDMIKTVSFEKTTYADLPAKFEAGTPNISGVIGVGAAVDYLQQIGLSQIAAYEHELLAYGTKALQSIPGVRLIGTAANKAAVLSFVMDGIHPHDIGTVLDAEGIAIRTGHHCAQPVMTHFGVPATARASLAFYNTIDEIDALINGLRKVVKVFS